MTLTLKLNQVVKIKIGTYKMIIVHQNAQHLPSAFLPVQDKEYLIQEMIKLAMIRTLVIQVKRVLNLAMQLKQQVLQL